MRLAALAAQRQALLHAELVLLVHDHQAQLGELDLVLEQRVGADGELRLACRDAFGGGLLVLFLQAAGQPHRRDAQRLQPVAQLEVMLLGEDFGGRHQRDLVAVFDGLQGGQRGDDGLAAADIALQQALHRVRLFQVVADFAQHFLLRGGQRKRQRLQQLLRMSAVARGSCGALRLRRLR